MIYEATKDIVFDDHQVQRTFANEIPAKIVAEGGVPLILRFFSFLLILFIVSGLPEDVFSLKVMKNARPKRRSIAPELLQEVQFIDEHFHGIIPEGQVSLFIFFRHIWSKDEPFV